MAIVPIARARIAHRVPGRLRLRFEPGADIQGTALGLEELLGRRPGFAGLETRPAARSIVVRYDPAQLDLERLLGEGALAEVFELLRDTTQEAAGAGETSIGRTVLGVVGAANGGIRRATGGFADLRDVFPLTLFGFGLQRVAQGNLQPVPWYNLLYYGYTTFNSLHGRSKSEPEPDAVEILRRRYARGELSDDEFSGMMARLGAPLPT
jgi:hypothetical protein